MIFVDIKTVWCRTTIESELSSASKKTSYKVSQLSEKSPSLLGKKRLFVSGNPTDPNFVPLTLNFFFSFQK